MGFFFHHKNKIFKQRFLPIFDEDSISTAPDICNDIYIYQYMFYTNITLLKLPDIIKFNSTTPGNDDKFLATEIFYCKLNSVF